MSEFSRDDVEATLAVRREQGAEMEQALVDSMAAKIEATVRRRFEAEVAERKRDHLAQESGQGGRIAVAVVSLVLAIPMSAIAGAMAGLAGLLVVWVGIVLVNVAMGMRRPPRK